MKFGLKLHKSICRFEELKNFSEMVDEFPSEDLSQFLKVPDSMNKMNSLVKERIVFLAKTKPEILKYYRDLYKSLPSWKHKVGSKRPRPLFDDKFDF